METEDWEIIYDMQTRTETVRVDEPLRIETGYHNALKRFWLENQFAENDKDPVYKTRDRNYVELLSLGFTGGFTLPLTKRKDLEEAVLLCDSNHPIKLVAPDKREYIHSE